MRQTVHEKLSATEYCSLTTDLWTSRQTMGYMTVTCHFISEEWGFESFVLETAHIDVEHTAVNLSSELRRITDKWNISNKIHCITTDNAKNIRNAVTQQKWNSHVLPIL